MLFTDIEGSTRLLKQLGERYGELLAEQRRLLREAFAAHAGREMDTQGDAFFVVFTRARNALEAALAAQLALAAHEWPDGVECRVRIGLHTGEPSPVGDEGYHGIGLHRGARIAGAAHGGQVLLSGATAGLVQDDLPGGMSLRDLGELQLKDIDRPERVYQLLAEGLRSEFPPLQTAPPKRPRPRLAIMVTAGVVALAGVAGTVILVTGGSGSPATTSAAPVSADSVGIFNSDTGRLTGQIPVGAAPTAVAACDNSIWAASGDSHSVSRIDPIKQVVVASITVGNGPDGIGCGDGFVWVANGLDGTVTKIDPQLDQPVDTIGVGNGAAGVAVGLGFVWVANADDGSVTRIDPRTDKPLPSIPIGESADGVAVGYGSLWVTSEVSGTVTRVDPGSGSRIPIQAGGGSDAVTTGAGGVWVANGLDGTVTRIDAATNMPSAAIPVGEYPNGIAAVDGAVWVSNEFAGTLTRIDPASDTPGRPVTTGNRPAGIVVDSGSLFVAVGASGAGHRGGTLTVLTSSGYLNHVDPALAYDSPENQVAALTHDGLTGFLRVGGSAGLQLVPDLAVSLPTPTDGGRTYSFQLRTGIHYSTGAVVRPQDFRRAIERTLRLSRQGAFNAPYYADIVGARKCLAAPTQPCNLSRGIETHAGSNTITFHLTSPDPDFLTKLDLPSAFAVPAGTPLHPRGFLPATGPYEIASFDPKLGIRLVRNPRFREWSAEAQPNGFPDAIVERVQGSPDAHVSAVLSGSADLASGESRPSPATLAAVRTQHASQLELNPWEITYFLALNARVAPFDDVRVRQALNFAVDRQRLLDLAFGPGLGQATCQVIPPRLLGYRRYCPYTAEPSASGAWAAPDLSRARQLVRASGTAGQAVTIWMPPEPHVDAAAGRYVVSVLNGLGYRARLRFTNEYKLAYQATFSGWYPDYAPPPTGMIVPTLSCAGYIPVAAENTNSAEFCDPAIDREIAHAQALQTSDPQAAWRLWAKVDRDLTDQAPWVSYANGVALEVKSTRVGNYQYNPQWGTLLAQLWVR
jgi:YVTN family beta-propeller protein